jgi:cellulose synthase (UDP-forming)
MTATVPRASGTVPARVPQAESRHRQLAIRAVAVLAVLATTVYLVWRAAATLDMSVWWLALPLLGLEVHALLSLLLFMPPLWDLDAVQPPDPVDETSLRLAVLVPTYNEPLDVLLPTVAAAVSIALPHETWVLDDGERPEVAALADALGARYLARPVRDHAKAGNVNYALARVDADVVAVLDADHVADRNLLRHTLGYFADPGVALVQTPQDFYNVDSFEHQEQRASRWRPWPRRSGEIGSQRFSEQELFYRAMQPGRNRFDAAFCCGTGAVLRTAALRAVGGLATETVTEDIHTSIRLHRAGWRTRYHNEVLARGLAAADAAQYLVQRVRWGTGAMQVLRRENPAYVSGLTAMQRLSYLGTLLGWFDSWRSLGYLLAPMVVLMTGAVPVRSDAVTFGLAFGTVFLLQRWALRALSRGMAPQGIATVFELVRMPATLLATTRLVSRRERAFTVTAKGRTGDRRARMHVPRLLVLLLLATVASAAWFGGTLLGLTPTTYRVPWAAYASLGWLLVNGALLALAIRRIRQERFGAERRASVRFDVSGTAELDGEPAVLLDASLTGALVMLPRDAVRTPAVDDLVALDLDLGTQRQAYVAVVRSVRTPRSAREQGDDRGPDAFVVGLELTPGQDHARAALALALFASDAEPRFVPPQRPEPSDLVASAATLATAGR